MSLHPATLHALQYQARRRAHFAGLIPPDRVEMEACMKRVDAILDRAPKVFMVAADGEIIWDDASPNVLDQVAGVQLTANTIGGPEPILTDRQRRRWRDRGGDDDGLVPA